MSKSCHITVKGLQGDGAGLPYFAADDLDGGECLLRSAAVEDLSSARTVLERLDPDVGHLLEQLQRTGHLTPAQRSLLGEIRKSWKLPSSACRA